MPGVFDDLDDDADASTDDPPKEKCRVSVAARRVGDAPAGWHTFVRYTCDNPSRVIEFQGGADKSKGCGADLLGDSYGGIRVLEQYRSSAGPEQVLVAAGLTSGSTLRCLRLEALQINLEPRTCYEVLGPNSNSVTYTLLTRCDLPALKPDVWAPGWGTLLG